MMDFHPPHVLLACFIFAIFQIRNWTGALECNSINGVCCSNYYREKNQCKECPLGSYGVNCNTTCPQNYFGRFCEKSCNCSIHQYCTSAIGCIQIENVTERNIFASNTTAASNQASSQQTSVWKITIFAFLVFTVFGLFAAGMISLKLRKQKIQLQSRFQFVEEHEHENNCVAPRNTEEANFETASRSFHEHSPRETMDILDNIHCDRRTSEMMNTDSISTADNIHLAAYLKHKEIINECKHELTYFDLEVETNNKHGSVSSYGQLHMSIHYSVLSLKVDLDPSTAELYDPSKIKTDDEYDFIEFYDIDEKRISKGSQPEYGACSHLNETRKKVENGDDI